MLQDRTDEVSSKQAENTLLTTINSPRAATHLEGMIRVPDAMKALRASIPHEHYAGDLYNNGQLHINSTDSISPKEHGVGRSKLFGRLMLGSLAGLLVMEGFGERGGNGDHPDGRGLFALSTPPTLNVANAIRSLKGNIFTPGIPFTFLVKILLVFSLLAYAIFLYLFSSKPKSSTSCKDSMLAAAPSLASPIEVRRKAWLTAIQTVGFPRHRMFPELIALHLEAMRYIGRQFIGWSSFAWLLNQTEEDEVARVRAWDIAIDAQLTGGDSEVSKSRLVLTIFASGTLPSTPTRLMLKALHIRILLWEASKSG